MDNLRSKAVFLLQKAVFYFIKELSLHTNPYKPDSSSSIAFLQMEWKQNALNPKPCQQAAYIQSFLRHTELQQE